MPGRWYDMNPKQWRTIVAIMIALGVVYGCLVVFVLVSITRERPLPFQYEDITTPGMYPRQLCPGDFLRFDLRVTVANAPSVVMVAENWQGASGGPSIADASPRWYVQELAKVAESTQSIAIPTLPPGRWVYERAGSVNTVDHPALLLVPFEVRGDC